MEPRLTLNSAKINNKRIKSHVEERKEEYHYSHTLKVLFKLCNMRTSVRLSIILCNHHSYQQLLSLYLSFYLSIEISVCGSIFIYYSNIL